jgi:peptidoglycan/LPS O-acetylase OafA/YrhL
MDMPTFQFLGKISYSVYLNHAILIFLFPKVTFSVFHLPQTLGLEIAVMISAVLFVIVYSHFTYNLIEVGAGNALKRLWMRRTPVPIKERAI